MAKDQSPAQETVKHNSEPEQWQSNAQDGEVLGNKKFEAEYGFHGTKTYNKFNITCFYTQIKLNIDYNRQLNVQHVEKEIDALYAKVLKDIQTKNPYDDQAMYWIVVSDKMKNSKFHMGNRTIGQFDDNELSRVLFKISQSAQDFVFRDFTMDVYLYPSGTGYGWRKTMDRSRAPEVKSEEKGLRCLAKIKNKGLGIHDEIN